MVCLYVLLSFSYVLLKEKAYVSYTRYFITYSSYLFILSFRIIFVFISPLSVLLSLRISFFREQVREKLRSDRACISTSILRFPLFWPSMDFSIVLHKTGLSLFGVVITCFIFWTSFYSCYISKNLILS